MTVTAEPVRTEYINLGNKTRATQKLFVYGIFLGANMRSAYDMTDPQYDTVSGYLTVGGHIVQAVAVPHKDVALTGLVVDLPVENWKRLDGLEAGYDRIIVKTNSGVTAYMYAAPDRGKDGKKR